MLRLIAIGVPVLDTAHQLCHEVEAFLPGVICTVMTVDPAGLLDPLAAPSLPAEFSAAIRGVMKGTDVGSCGTAAYMRQPVFVTDIANDPKWAKVEDPALAADLRESWAPPTPGHDSQKCAALGVD